MTETTRPRLIGLYSSSPGCGKTTVALHLMHMHGYYLHPFASPLKHMVQALLHDMRIDALRCHDLVHRNKSEPIPEIDERINTRHLLRTLGTEWGRQCIHPDLWLRAWRPRFDLLCEMDGGTGCVVVDDVRFDNEARLIHELGGHLWHIQRPENAEDPSAHASDGALDTFSYFDQQLVNAGTIADLEQSVDTLLAPTHATA